MDPVTAFGLAAGILLVIDVSFKALKTCREIYKEGSSQSVREASEIVKALTSSTQLLPANIDGEHTGSAEYNMAIIDVSTKCSRTAKELSDELEKLSNESGSSRLQALGKSLRIIRKKRFLADMQDKLERYQRILETEILVGLNAQTVEQMRQYNGLNENVKDLAKDIGQGQNALAQIMADQKLAICDHVDMRLESHEQRDTDSQLQTQFQNSLFFPEIFSRNDNISDAYSGTCGWIFETVCPEDQAIKQPWPDFGHWLKYGTSRVVQALPTAVTVSCLS